MLFKNNFLEQLNMLIIIEDYVELAALAIHLKHGIIIEEQQLNRSYLIA
jgi:hypothetical protein